MTYAFVGGGVGEMVGNRVGLCEGCVDGGAVIGLADIGRAVTGGARLMSPSAVSFVDGVDVGDRLEVVVVSGLEVAPAESVVPLVGNTLGCVDGLEIGEFEGFPVGLLDGDELGPLDGDALGLTDGEVDGEELGLYDGAVLGLTEGEVDGVDVVGVEEGDLVGGLVEEG